MRTTDYCTTHAVSRIHVSLNFIYLLLGLIVKGYMELSLLLKTTRKRGFKIEYTIFLFILCFSMTLNVYLKIKKMSDKL